MTQNNGKGILDTLGGIFGGAGKGLLDNLKTLDPQQIQSVLGVLKQSGDAKVQTATADLAKSQNDGETFVEKLKGYASVLEQYLPKLLAAIKKD